ncbi:MAG TPA: hypothetical protein VLZ03_02205 [Thermodesulfobacteriota bacterium]|jgi:hypothetical protein|nr:hypothetical protein [Thermodesulfobacteriota bacterium]
MDVFYEIDQIGKALPRKGPPIPVLHPCLGPIGEASSRDGFRLKYMTRRTFHNLLKDEERFRKNPRLALCEMGAITNWGGDVVNARANGKGEDIWPVKLSQTTVASQWSSFFRSGGIPGAGTYPDIATYPYGLTLNNATAGAFPLQSPTGSNEKFIKQFGAQHKNGTNLVMLIDILWAAGNLQYGNYYDFTSGFPGFSRGDGWGIMAAFEVTTQLGASRSIGIGINDTEGWPYDPYFNSTGSCAVYRLQPASVPFMQLDDAIGGVGSLNYIDLSNLTAGVMALLLFKPLCFVPTLATTDWGERPIRNTIGGVIPLYKEEGGNIGCLSVLVLTSTTSTGIQQYLVETFEG